MTPPRLRTALTQLPLSGDLRSRTLRWRPSQMSDTDQEQHNARRIPAHPEQHQPPPSAPRQRPEHTTTADPPPRYLLIPSPRRQTPTKNDTTIDGPGRLPAVRRMYKIRRRAAGGEAGRPGAQGW